MPLITQPIGVAEAELVVGSMSLESVRQVLLEYGDETWTINAAVEGSPAKFEDRGVYWIVLDGRWAWPVRVLVVNYRRQKRAVWVGKSRDSDALWVETKASDWVNPAQAGDSGRALVLSMPGEPDPESPIDDEDG